MVEEPFAILDAALVRAVDAACGEAVRKGAASIACRPGCTECCIGAFPISQADAARLVRGLSALASRDPERAGAVQQRARDAMSRVAPDAPALAGGEPALDALIASAEDEPCPALDPQTGLCDLYEHRPLTCRMFGPALRSPSGGIGVCELCFEGATDDDIESCAVDLDSDALESPLIEAIEKASGKRGSTIVAAVLSA
ncbi:MAG TPA: YkgJ family cysteine cluster protein [Bryobacteraceae bacterium]|nr:YkgJ family cysteine cluster protein [Bryobacteraceae bacterium]